MSASTDTQPKQGQNFEIPPTEKLGDMTIQPMQLYFLNCIYDLLSVKQNEFIDIGDIQAKLKSNCRTDNKTELKKYNNYALLTGNGEYNKYLYVAGDKVLRVNPTKLQSYELFQQFIDTKMNEYIFEDSLDKCSSPTFYKTEFKLKDNVNAATIIPYNNKDYVTNVAKRNPSNACEALIANLNNSLQRGIMDVLHAHPPKVVKTKSVTSFYELLALEEKNAEEAKAKQKQARERQAEKSKNKMTIDCSITMDAKGIYTMRTNAFIRKFNCGIIKYYTNEEIKGFVLHTASANPIVINPKPNRLDTVFSILGGGKDDPIQIQTTKTVYGDAMHPLEFRNTSFMSNSKERVPIKDSTHFHDYLFPTDVLYTTFGQIKPDNVIILNERGIFVMSKDFTKMSQLVLDGIDIMTRKTVYTMSDIVIRTFANYCNLKSTLVNPSDKYTANEAKIELVNVLISNVFAKLPGFFKTKENVEAFREDLRSKIKSEGKSTFVDSSDVFTVSNSPYCIYGKQGDKINSYDLSRHPGYECLIEACKRLDEYYSNCFIPTYNFLFGDKEDISVDAHISANKELFGSLYNVYPSRANLQFKLTINSLDEFVYMLISLLPSRVVYGKDMSSTKSVFNYCNAFYNLCTETINYINVEDINKLIIAFNNMHKQISTNGFPYR